MSNNSSRSGSRAQSDRRQVQTNPPPEINRTIVNIPTVQIQRIKERPDSIYQQILHSLYDGVLITDAIGRILYTNARIEHMLRFSHEELMGSGATEYICYADDTLLKEIRDSSNEQRSTLLQANCMRKDMSLFPAEIAISSLKTDKEERLCFLFRDITARKKKERLLLKAQEDRIEAENIKARMSALSALSHEINNPLQMLMSLVEKEGHVQYQEPLSRIVTVLRELQKEDAFIKVIGADGSPRYELNIKHPEIPCSPNNIIIAEDEATMINLFKEIINRAMPDAHIELTANGQECLDTFSNGHHKIIILDINMPVMSGEETSKQITAMCEERNWQKPHFIFWTGFVPPESVIKIVGDGSYNAILAKPFPMGDLITHIKRFL